MQSRIQSIDYEVEECRQCGEAVSFSVLFIPDSHTGKKGKDVILGEWPYVPFPELSLEFGKNELVAGKRIFFWNLPRGNPGRI